MTNGIYWGFFKRDIITIPVSFFTEKKIIENIIIIINTISPFKTIKEYTEINPYKMIFFPMNIRKNMKLYLIHKNNMLFPRIRHFL